MKNGSLLEGSLSKPTVTINEIIQFIISSIIFYKLAMYDIFVEQKPISILQIYSCILLLLRLVAVVEVHVQPQQGFSSL